MTRHMAANPLLRDMKAGVRLQADGGFTCLANGEVAYVEMDEKGFPFVSCRDGRHWLGGQVDRRGFLVGLTRVYTR